MKDILALLLFCATVSSQAPLKCRRCAGAASLDDCTFTIPCPSNEVCYMDEVVTDQLTIEYNGGCRPRDVCARGPAVGKRSDTQIVCSQCCDTVRNPECNTKLCGIKSRNANQTQCYHCASDGTGGIGVDDPNKCTRLTTCSSTQMCGAETYRLSSDIYEFKCLPKTLCTLITVEALKHLDECRHPGADPELCGNVLFDHNVTRRAGVGFKMCTACCGDSQCNSESCTQILDRLYKLWKAGVLDLHTLKATSS